MNSVPNTALTATSPTMAKRSRDVDGPGAFAWGGEWRAAVSGNRKARRAPLPAVGDVVTCRVQRMTPRLATVEILCVGNDTLREACPGLIRREEVQPGAHTDPLEVYRSFRPGDIILARVRGLGDSRAYYLGVAEPELGVVLARSSEGTVMTPVSYCEMEDPITKVREPRKCAKPKQLDLPEPAAASEQPAATSEGGGPESSAAE